MQGRCGKPSALTCGLFLEERLVSAAFGLLLNTKVGGVLKVEEERQFTMVREEVQRSGGDRRLLATSRRPAALDSPVSRPKEAGKASKLRGDMGVPVSWLRRSSAFQTPVGTATGLTPNGDRLSGLAVTHHFLLFFFSSTRRGTTEKTGEGSVGDARFGAAGKGLCQCCRARSTMRSQPCLFRQVWAGTTC